MNREEDSQSDRPTDRPTVSQRKRGSISKTVDETGRWTDSQTDS